MYKGSNWTAAELGNVPDENPSIECERCEVAFSWMDYWKPRVVEGDRVEDPSSDEPWYCDDCHEERKKWERREENNHKLTGWI